MPELTGTPKQQVAVVGGGVAGLVTALQLRDGARAGGRDLAVTLFEKEQEPGGNLRTLRLDGWQLEWGPNGFLDNEPATLRLVERLGLNEQLERSSDLARRRFLVVANRLQEIPTAPGPFLRSGMLSTGAKLRMAGELFVPRRKNLGQADVDPDTDETVAQFGNRRLGAGFTETLLDPMVKGIFGGNAHNLSLAAAFPRMVELEQQYGGLFKAMISLGRQRRKEGKGSGDGASGGPSGTLHSFKGGMEVLIRALVDALEGDPQVEFQRGQPVDQLTYADGHWWVTAEGGSTGPFTAVINAAPAHAAADQLQQQAPEISSLLRQIPYAPMAVIALGFDRQMVGHDLQGFGMLIPSQEKRELLGALWTSSIFQGRAPDGKVLIRCMAGGADNPAILELNDEELVTLALAELRQLMELRGSPVLQNVIRHERAIAQYVPGHPARLRSLANETSRWPGLYLTGSSYKGISVNYCVKEAEITADQVLAALQETTPSTPREAH